MTANASIIRVMLVDDSAVVRGLTRRVLRDEPSIEVVSAAINGIQAIEALKLNPVDVIVLDIEMPEMDGITALPELLKIAPDVKIIMSSTVTQHNAAVSFFALQQGAVDYIAKPTALGEGDTEEFFRQLVLKIKQLGATKRKVASAEAMLAQKPAPLTPLPASKIEAIGIASSTGGPQALGKVLAGLKGRTKHIPIFITQHMPPNFTTILAEHLSKAIDGDCHEAKDGEEVKAGVVYMAPGDFHMTVERSGTAVKLRLDKNPPENFCRPAADPMLRSLAQVYRNHLTVAVLTGMGSDGAKGAAEVVKAGGVVIAEHEVSCVVYGMPKAVVDAQLATAVLTLGEIPPYLIHALEAK